MALSKNVEAKFCGDLSIVIENAYIKIVNVIGNKEKVFVEVGCYKNKETKAHFKTVTYDFVPSMDNKNFIQQGYEYLKTLPEFADAVDC